MGTFRNALDLGIFISELPECPPVFMCLPVCEKSLCACKLLHVRLLRACVASWVAARVTFSVPNLLLKQLYIVSPLSQLVIASYHILYKSVRHLILSWFCPVTVGCYGLLTRTALGGTGPIPLYQSSGLLLCTQRQCQKTTFSNKLIDFQISG